MLRRLGGPSGGLCHAHPEGRQYLAFYDAERRMTVAARALDSDKWDMVRLPSQVAWDKHNYITMTADRDGLTSRERQHGTSPRWSTSRTAKPYDIHSFERLPMTAAGDALDVSTLSAQRSGRPDLHLDEVESYPSGPTVRADEVTQCDGPRHSVNGLSISDATRASLIVDVVDLVAVVGSCRRDSARRHDQRQHQDRLRQPEAVVVTYHKFDSRGFTQIMNAGANRRLEDLSDQRLGLPVGFQRRRVDRLRDPCTAQCETVTSRFRPCKVRRRLCGNWTRKR